MCFAFYQISKKCLPPLQNLLYMESLAANRAFGHLSSRRRLPLVMVWTPAYIPSQWSDQSDVLQQPWTVHVQCVYISCYATVNKLVLSYLSLCLLLQWHVQQLIQPSCTAGKGGGRLIYSKGKIPKTANIFLLKLWEINGWKVAGVTNELEKVYRFGQSPRIRQNLQFLDSSSILQTLTQQRAEKQI